MHIDENKKLDKRNIERHIKNGVITKKDYEAYLAKLPDRSDMAFNPDEESEESNDFDPNDQDDISLKSKNKKRG